MHHGLRVYRHSMKVLFVGSNPSEANLKTEQPFIGTRSHKKLLQWIDWLGVEDYTLINASDKLGSVTLGDMNFDRLQDSMIRHDVVIALGRVAEKAVKTAGRKDYLYLPHPSPRNRVLNDKHIEHWYIDSVRLSLFLKAI